MLYKSILPWLKRLRRLAVLYLAYALACNIFPFIGHRPVREETRKRFDQLDFSGGDANGADHILLLETPAEALGARLAILREAKDTLDIVYHTIQAGESTDAFFAEVLCAADRGVSVRLVLDAKFGALEPQVHKTIQALAGHPNITLRDYAPLHLLKPWEWQILLHDKFIIVDSKLLILGGRNLGDRFYAPAGYEGHITWDRDVLVCNRWDKEGSVLEEADAYMEILWTGKETRQPAVRTKEEQQAVYSRLAEQAVVFEEKNPALYERSLQDYLQDAVPTRKIVLLANPTHTRKKEPVVAYGMARLAQQAKSSVLLQTPYATANRYLLEHLEEINKSCPITVVTNSPASSPNLPAYSNYYSQRKKFLATGVSIYEYQSAHSIHGKSIVVDDRFSAVGSLNMDDRSFYLDTETMLVVDSPEFAQVLTGAVDTLRHNSLLLDPQTNDYLPEQPVEKVPVSWGKKAMMALVSVFSRLFQFLI